MADIQRQAITFVQDGFEIQAYTAAPPSGGPGVLVLHAWWGLTPFFRQVCDRLAAQGFVALAPDMYGGVTADTIDEARQALETRQQGRSQAATLGGLAQLQQLPGVKPGGVGVIGFSMGAAWSLEASVARPQDVAAVVLFYGVDMPDFGPAQAAYQGHFAEQDEWEPLEGVNALQTAIQQAGRPVHFHYYPGVSHWFFEDNRPDAYNADAAALAWERTISFLTQELGGGFV